MCNTANQVYYGRGVIKLSGTADGCDIPATNTQQFEGVALWDINNPYAGYYLVNSAIPVLKLGRCFVEVAEAMTPDQTILMEVGSAAVGAGLPYSGNHVPGRFCVTADGNNTVALTTVKIELINSFTDKNGIKVALVNIAVK
jgi:hypothetical protein